MENIKYDKTKLMRVNEEDYNRLIKEGRLSRPRNLTIHKILLVTPEQHQFIKQNKLNIGAILRNQLEIIMNEENKK